MDQLVGGHLAGDVALEQDRPAEPGEIVGVSMVPARHKEEVEGGATVGDDGSQGSVARRVTVGLGGEGHEDSRSWWVVHPGAEAGQVFSEDLGRVGAGMWVGNVRALEDKLGEELLPGGPMPVQRLAGDTGPSG